MNKGHINYSDGATFITCPCASKGLCKGSILKTIIEKGNPNPVISDPQNPELKTQNPRTTSVATAFQILKGQNKQSSFIVKPFKSSDQYVRHEIVPNIG